MKFHHGPLTVEFTLDEVLTILVDHVREQTMASGLLGPTLLIDGTDALATHERIEIVFAEGRK